MNLQSNNVTLLCNHRYTGEATMHFMCVFD